MGGMGAVKARSVGKIRRDVWDAAEGQGRQGKGTSFGELNR